MSHTRSALLRRSISLATITLLVGVSALAVSCAPKEAVPVTAATPIANAQAYDPAAWKDAYPNEYATWLKTKDPRPVGKSKYKRGGDAGRQFDKLSEYPFLSAITSGIGFAVEYNEPRGHYYALIDQQAIDPARLKAGGVCLACKSSYFTKLSSEQGKKLLSMPYAEAVNLLPENARQLGPACVDCHDNETLKLRPSREAMTAALAAINVNAPDDRQQQLIVCGQCHCTYVIPKSPEGKSIGLFYPWAGGTWGNISIERIIDNIEADKANHEWTQKLTGFKLGYIRHPEFELYTMQSTHFVNGVTCPDCHMPFQVEGGAKFSTHDAKGALDMDMQPCLACHPQNRDQLRSAVIRIQDQVVGTILNAGYAVAADATLFQEVNSKVDTTTAENKQEYEAAKDAYLQAFYRAAFLTAENSVGFHNPTEANRIGAAALAYSQRCSGILRQMLARNGVAVPLEVQLNLPSFLYNRGTNKLAFDPAFEFKDPSGVAEALWKGSLAELRSGKVPPAAETTSTPATSGATTSP